MDEQTAVMTSDRVRPGPFHRRLAVAGAGGVYADGYGLGIVGIALANAGGDLSLGPLATGLVGGSALAGLFIGALATGPIADRVGRRPIFAANMAVLLLLSVLQCLVSSVALLVLCRFLIGATLGTDYVVSKAMLAEWMPQSLRGRVLAGLAVAWAAGYASAYFIGYAIEGMAPRRVALDAGHESLALFGRIALATLGAGDSGVVIKSRAGGGRSCGGAQGLRSRG